MIAGDYACVLKAKTMINSSSQPLVTIGMTAYNAADTLEVALQSALAQDWTHTEIVVVNDASTDGTADILQKYATQHEQIRLFHHPENKGVAAARCRIVEEAKGEFIAFFDDDDTSTADRITRQYERIIQYEDSFAGVDPVICHTARRQIYPDGVVRIEPTMGVKTLATAPHGKAVARRILTGKPIADVFGSIATCSQMGRTENYRKLGNFDPSFRRGQDTEFNIRFALAGGHFVGIADPLVTQTMTYGSEKRLRQEKEYFIKAIDKHSDFVSDYMDPAFAKAWIETKYKYLEGNKASFSANLLGLFLKYPKGVAQRLYWSLPNRGFNRQFSNFHREAS
jgi:glycosyltransferase involved in cell wall biosynthesis